MKTRYALNRFFTLLAAGILAGATAVAAPFEWTGASGVNQFWSTAANWSPSGPPVATDDALFFDQGAMFDDVTINNIVTADTTVQFLWLGQTNGIHNMQINGGVTLTISNSATDGSALLIAGTETAVTATTIISNTISGDGSLVIAGSTDLDAAVDQQNIQGSIVVAQKHGSGGNHWSTLDMRNLASFFARVSLFRVGWSDTTLRRAQGYVILAKTNHITVAGGDGEAGITVGDNRGNNNNNSGFCVLWLGQENTIHANTVRFGSQKSQGRLFFTPGLVEPRLTLRGMDGVGRTEIFAVGDNHQQGASGNPCAGTVDLSDGSVDLLIDTVYIARGQTSTGRESVADVTFGTGMVNVNTLEVAYQSAPDAPGANNNRVDGDLTLNGTTMVVNDLLRLARWGGSPDGWIFARMFVTNGATLLANSIVSEIVNDTSYSQLVVDSSTLIVTNTASGIRTLSLTDSLVQPVGVGGAPAIQTSELTTGGTSNTIQIGRLPGILSYPAQFRLIDFEGTIGGAGFNFGMTGLNVAYTGYLSNNVADASIDLVLTSGPIAQSVTWNGTSNGIWDTTTFNWLVGATSTNYADGDFPVFNDVATGTTSVNVTTEVFPSEVTINNSAKTYTFSGSGAIAGVANLVKAGSGTVIVENANTYVGSTTISNGTIRIGNGGTVGNLGSGNIINHGGLVFARSDDLEVVNPISGSAAGSITKNQSNTLTLSGNSSYSGNVTVTTGTLRTGSGTALGDEAGGTTINAGATLDVNAQSLGAEPVTTSGAGVGAAGAIVNNGSGQQLNALRYVTITADTTFGGTERWDLRAPGGTTGDPTGAALSTGGVAHNLTKVGENQVNIVSATIDPALANITIEEGILGFEGNITSAGNPSSTLTVKSNATLRFWAITNRFNKVIVVEDGGILSNGDGNNTVIGPMTLQGLTTIDAGGISLTLSNAIGGNGSIVKLNDDTLILAGPANTYTGSTTVSNGTLLINGPNNGGGSLITVAGSTLGGTGTHSGTVAIGGSLQPGNISVPGTLGTGDLTLDAAAMVTFDLSTNLTIGGGVNDLLEVNGDLTVSGNSLSLNLYQLKLAAGTYRLVNYSGNLIGNLNTNISLGGATRYGLALDTNTPGQINLVVTGSPDSLVWQSTSSSTWDVAVSSNWFNTDIAAADAFFQGDEVLFDDTAGLVTTIDIAAGAAVSPATATINSTNNVYTINGPGKISGGASLVKQGDSTLVVNSTNDFNGAVVIQRGILQIGNNSSLGTVAGGTVISNGATLDVGAVGFAANAVNLGLESITVSGAGASGQGAIISSALLQQQNALRLVTLVGDTTFGGPGDYNAANSPGRWDMRGAGAALSTGGNAYNITKIGANQVTLVGVTVDPALGNIDVQQGSFNIETTSTTGDPTKTISIQPGARLAFFNLTPPVDKRIAVTNGQIANLSGSAVIVGPVILDGPCTLSAGGTSLTFSNVLSGAGSLTKVLGATVNLAAANTYTGDTSVDAGVLALLGNGSIANSPNINLAPGSILNVSGRTDGKLTLSSGRALVGSGTVQGSLQVNAGATIAPGNPLLGVLISALTVSDVVTLGGSNVMEIDKSSLTNDVIRSATSIQYGGTLVVSEISSIPFADGDTFKLFDAASYSGTFTSITPATPAAGLFWDTSQLTSSGTLRVVATAPPPSITSVVISGNNLVLSGSGGPANGQYYVLSSTDVALPISSWTPIATNSFGPAGEFSFTNAVNPSVPQRFYLLRLP